MFDFLAHWFARTEYITNNNGTRMKRPHRSHYKDGHFSLDLTFITIIIVIACLGFALIKVRQYYKKKNEKLFKALFDVELQQIKIRSDSNVVRTPFGRVPKKSAVAPTVIEA